MNRQHRGVNRFSIQQRLPGHPVRPLLALLAVALIGLGNPLACLLHCQIHFHPVADAPTGTHVHVTQHHHDPAALAHDTVRHDATTQLPSEDAPANTLCRSEHPSPSPLTVGVLLSLVLLGVYAPTLALRGSHLFLRLLTHPPPRRPPRLLPA